MALVSASYFQRDPPSACEHVEEGDCDEAQYFQRNRRVSPDTIHSPEATDHHRAEAAPSLEPVVGSSAGVSSIAKTVSVTSIGTISGQFRYR